MCVSVFSRFVPNAILKPSRRATSRELWEFLLLVKLSWQYFSFHPSFFFFPLAKMMNSGRVVMIKMGTLYLGLLLLVPNKCSKCNLQNTTTFFCNTASIFLTFLLTLVESWHYIAVAQCRKGAPFADWMSKLFCSHKSSTMVIPQFCFDGPFCRKYDWMILVLKYPKMAFDFTPQSF